MAYRHARAVFAYAPNALTPTERLTLLVLANYMDAEHNQAYPTVAQLASDSGTSERTISRVLKRLTELGCIRIFKNSGGSERTPKQYRPNLYIWTLWEDQNEEILDDEEEETIECEAGEDTQNVTPTVIHRGDTTGQNRGDKSGKELSTGVTPRVNRGDTVGTHKSQLKPITPLTPQALLFGQSRKRKPKTKNPRRLMAELKAQEELQRLEAEKNNRLIHAWQNRHKIISMMTDFCPADIFHNQPGKEFTFIAKAKEIIIQNQGNITPHQLTQETLRALGMDSVCAA